MKRYILLFLFFAAVLLSGIQSAYSQSSEDIKGAGGDLFAGRTCAPVIATYEARFFSYNVTPFDLDRLKIQIEWKDGKVDTYTHLTAVPLLEEPGPGGPNDYKFKYYVSAAHQYEVNGERCEYDPTAKLFIDNKEVSEKVTRNLVVWDKDNANGGEIIAAPQLFQACPGESFTVTFEDQSRWNCTPPDERDKMNKYSRWTRFTYGTVETLTGRNRINGVKAGGTSIVNPSPYTTPLKGEVKAHLYNGRNEVLFPDHQSLPVLVPADAKVGEIFEIKLENWNLCNPYDPADESNAISTYAYIEIVEPPKPEILAPENVCPNEVVKLTGNSLNFSNVEYRWEVFENEFGTGTPVKWHGKVFDFAGFTSAGPKLVKLRIRRKGTNVDCWNEETKVINVFNAPTVTAKINGAEQTSLDLCFDGATPSKVVKYSHNINSSNNYSYTYKTFLKNSIKTTPDGPDGPTGSVGAGTAFTSSYEATYTDPGKYRVLFVATDLKTNCKTEIESVVIIYDTPQVDFTAPVLCEGQPTLFKATASLGISINSDKITGYEWDFGDGTAVITTDKDTISHSYADGGEFPVKLTVNTKGACPVTVTKSITVNKVPEARLSSDYSVPICPGDVNFTNLSRAVNSTAFGGDDQVTYKLVMSDGVESSEEDFDGTTRALTFENTTDVEVTYQVWLKAKAANWDCETLSEPLEVKVKPGAKANFYEPDYDIFDAAALCSKVDFNFIVDKATLSLAGDKHQWIITNETTGVEVYKATFGPADAGYAEISFEGANTGANGLVYKVELRVEKAGLCISPVSHRYRVNPRPEVDFTTTVETDCEYTFIKVKVPDLTGVKRLIWDIPEPPLNAGSITYDDEFELIYKKPNKNDVVQQIIMKLDAENYFDCTMADGPVEHRVDNYPQVMETAVLKLLSSVTEGCSPLEVDFKNETEAPAGTKYEFYISKHGVDEETLAVLPADVYDGTEREFSYTFTDPGFYKVRLKALATDGCETFSGYSVTLRVNDYPVPDFSLFKDNGCSSAFYATITNNTQNSAVNHWSIKDLSDNSLIDLSADNSGVYSTTDVSVVESFNFTAENGVVQEYEIILVAESGSGCQADPVSRKVTIFPKAVASFDIDKVNLCAPYTITVTNNALARNPPVADGTKYTWSWGDGTSTVSAEPQVSYTYTGTVSTVLSRDVTLTVTTPNGCSEADKKTIILQPAVKAVFTSNITEGCSPLALYLYDNSEGNIDEYKWKIVNQADPSEIIIIDKKNPNDDLPEYFENTGTTTKIYEVSLTVKNLATGCESSTSKLIKILPVVKAEFGIEVKADNCSETEVKFTNLNIQPGIEYTWNWGNGEPAVKIDQPTENQIYLNASTTRVKDYEVTLSAYNPVTKCTSKSAQIVRVNPGMKIRVAPDKQIGCAPLTVAFTNSSENVQDHEWYYRIKGTTEMEDLRSTPEADFHFDNLTTASIEYEVVYAATSPTGCRIETIYPILVYPAVNADFNVKETVLTQPDVTIEDITPLAAEVEGWNYHWDFGDGETSGEYNPGTHSYKTYGTYTITYTVWNEQCRDTSTKDIIINETKPVVEFESIPVSGCWPLVVRFANKSAFADPNSYKWDFGDGEGTATSINPNYTYHKPGQYTVSLTASNGSGDAVTVQHSIVNVYERPRISFELRETEVFVPGDPVYVANYTIGASQYFWDFGDGTTYEEFEPVHYYKEPGDYTISLVAMNEWGCADTLVKENVVNAQAGGKLKIPNAFTPSPGGAVGGDIASGKNNDVFFPVLEGGVTKYNLKIYSRWGELLFESNRREIGWDGYYKGQLCKSDVYVFKLAVEFSDGTTLDKLGDVTLIR